jgi:hypothetical protein
MNALLLIDALFWVLRSSNCSATPLNPSSWEVFFFVNSSLKLVFVA